MTTGRINQVASLRERRFESSRSESPRVDASLDVPPRGEEKRWSRSHGGTMKSENPQHEKKWSLDVLKRFDTHDVPTSFNARGFAYVVVEKFVA